MPALDGLRHWWQKQTGEDQTPFDGDSGAFVASLVFHMLLLIALGLAPLVAHDSRVALTITTPVVDEEEPELEVPEEFAPSEFTADEIGANSVHGDMMALSMAPEVSDISEVVIPVDMMETDVADVAINDALEVSTGLMYNQNLAVKGHAGQGETGAEGAIDRITHEILMSLEERKTLVVWFFDQSGSLTRQRAAIKDRFDRIYKELGAIEASGNEAFKKHDDKPLLSSVVAFGSTVSLLTPKPTDSVADLKSVVGGIATDTTGTENTFTALLQAAKQFTNYRIPQGEASDPERNVMLIVVTDEVGDDSSLLDTTVNYLRRYEMPVFVVGVPAPFGREKTMVKWVDPDPKFDQSAQWAEVSQGPESLRPERIKLSFSGVREDKQTVDSGFGPFALTRLCYETGGIYFAVHPNRNVRREVSRGETEAFSAHLTHFFDPQVMRRYRPDYVSVTEYDRRLRANKARAALVTAAGASWVTKMESPQLRFVKRDEASFATELTDAQRQAAKLAPKLFGLYETLQVGEADRKKETSPRWQAGFDLAVGRVAATMARTEAYNGMLAQAKTNLKFKDPKNNTWILKPADEITVGSQVEKLGKKAREYLERVVADHPGTPWAMMAQRELETPIGWKWEEEFTDLSPPRRGNGGGNNNNPPPPNDQRRMMQRPVKRPVPKL